MVFWAHLGAVEAAEEAMEGDELGSEAVKSALKRGRGRGRGESLLLLLLLLGTRNANANATEPEPVCSRRAMVMVACVVFGSWLVWCSDGLWTMD